MQHSPPPVRREHSFGGKAPVRVLQAPYQQKSALSSKGVGLGLGTSTANEVIGSSTVSTSSTESSSLSSSSSLEHQPQPDFLPPNLHHNVNDHVDYRNFVFQPLESESKVMFDKYCGPTPESNWVVPSMLLVGAYPASTDDEETLDLITSILKQGVNKFVCLQQEYRQFGVTEQMWRTGQALRPYFDDVVSIVQQKTSIACLTHHKVVDEEDLTFVHFPIRDCGVTDDDRVLELARELVKDIAEGRVIYLHCWGGHGRTGTLVCIMLHLMYGLDPTEAMARCQLVHDLRQCPVVVGSPQTQTQRDQVARVITKLMSQTSYNRRALSGDGSMLSSDHDASVPLGTDVVQHGSPRPSQTQTVSVSKPVDGGVTWGSGQIAATPTLVPHPSLHHPAFAQPYAFLADPLDADVSLFLQQPGPNAVVNDDVIDAGAAIVLDGIDGERSSAQLHFSQELLSQAHGNSLLVQVSRHEESEEEGLGDDSRMRLGSDWNAAGGLDDVDDDNVDDNEDTYEVGEVRMRVGSEWCDHLDEHDNYPTKQHNVQSQEQQLVSAGTTLSLPFGLAATAPMPIPGPPQGITHEGQQLCSYASSDETRATEPGSTSVSSGAVPPPSQTKPSFRMNWLGRKTLS